VAADAEGELAAPPRVRGVGRLRRGHKAQAEICDRIRVHGVGLRDAAHCPVAIADGLYLFDVECRCVPVEGAHEHLQHLDNLGRRPRGAPACEVANVGVQHRRRGALVVVDLRRATERDGIGDAREHRVGERRGKELVDVVLLSPLQRRHAVQLHRSEEGAHRGVVANPRNAGDDAGDDDERRHREPKGHRRFRVLIAVNEETPDVVVADDP